MAALQVQGVRKAFDRQPVLQGVDLAVGAGRLVAILGRSGSGKTTLLRLICGFERVDAGEIAIDGQRVSTPALRLPPEQRRIGYVAQEGALFPHLTVAANVLFGLPRAARRERHRAEALLEMVGLPAAYAARWPHELSGGEQQRVALARALAPAPRLVLLDEPFSSLDAALRVETREAVAAALRQAGATALLVTHDQAEALSLGQEVAVLRAGRVVQMATPEVLYRQPADAELARFVGEAVLLPGVADGGQVALRPRHVAARGRDAGGGGGGDAAPGAARAEPAAAAAAGGGDGERRHLLWAGCAGAARAQRRGRSAGADRPRSRPHGSGAGRAGRGRRHRRSDGVSASFSRRFDCALRFAKAGRCGPLDLTGLGAPDNANESQLQTPMGAPCRHDTL